MFDEIVNEIQKTIATSAANKVAEGVQEVAKPLMLEAKKVALPTYSASNNNYWNLMGQSDGFRENPMQGNFDSEQLATDYLRGYLQGEENKRANRRKDRILNWGIALVGGGIFIWSIGSLIKIFKKGN